jgi:hypothetical protein
MNFYRKNHEIDSKSFKIGKLDESDEGITYSKGRMKLPFNPDGQ